MSMEVINREGFGFNSQDVMLNTTKAKVEKMLLTVLDDEEAIKWYEKNKEYFKEDNDCELCELMEWYGIYFDDGCIYGLSALLKQVIFKFEGINVQICPDENKGCFILYLPSYPWKLTEKEKAITKEDLKKIYQKYISQLTDKPIEIDYITTEELF